MFDKTSSRIKQFMKKKKKKQRSSGKWRYETEAAIEAKVLEISGP
jgi:hypothetical protein